MKPIPVIISLSIFGMLMQACNHAVEANLDTRSITTNYETGELFQEYSITEDSVRHGAFIEYFKNGRIHQVDTFLEGRRNGLNIIYFSNGQAKSKHHYRSGIPDGKYQWFYETGNIKQEGHYSHGRINGEVQTYYESGELRANMHFVNDHKVGQQVQLDTMSEMNRWSYHNQEGKNCFQMLRIDKNWSATGNPIIHFTGRSNNFDHTLSIKIEAITLPQSSASVTLYRRYNGKSYKIKEIPSGQQLDLSQDFRPLPEGKHIYQLVYTMENNPFNLPQSFSQSFSVVYTDEEFDVKYPM